MGEINTIRVIFSLSTRGKKPVRVLHARFSRNSEIKVELFKKITSFKQARPRVHDIFNKYRKKPIIF